MIPIVGFAPDADPATPGLLADCTNLVPYLNGMRGGPSAQTPGDAPPLPAECIGAAVMYRLDNTRRIFAGTEDKIYELAGGAWADVSRAGDYTGGTSTSWSFAQFGNTTLMANRADVIQRSTGADFDDIASAPRAEVIFSVGAFIMALNTNDGDERPDGWHCCAAFDDTDWTPSISTQATKGRLVATPGPITAGARLGEYAIAYKNRSIYLAQYVGAPEVWNWTQISGGDAGCVGKNALCDIGGVHFFVGDDNFWLFDGTRPQPIGDGSVRLWWLENSNPVMRFKTIATFDRQNYLVWVFYASGDSDSLDHALVYHIKSGKWGRANRRVQASLDYVAPGATIDGLTDYSATIDGLPDVAFDSQFWLSGGRSLAIFNDSNQLQSLTGASSSSSFETGDAGDDDTVILLQQLRLRYEQAPVTATAQNLWRMNSGLPYTLGGSNISNDGKFDLMRSARWHRARVSFAGDVKVTHIKATYKPVGSR
jgi:hypothetical protein